MHMYMYVYLNNYSGHLCTTDPGLNLCDSQQKKFLAWQSEFLLCYSYSSHSLLSFTPCPLMHTLSLSFPLPLSLSLDIVYFIAWDLLRIDVFGFQSLCEDFFTRHPHHFISPLRISGSAVETLFGQYKYACGGKLESSNYATARAACMVRSIVTPHHSGKGYRDAPLSGTTLPLEKNKEVTVIICHCLFLCVCMHQLCCLFEFSN